MRTVLANATVSLDGYTAGPDPYDMSWLITHALDDRGRAHWAGIYSGATTALLGRRNFEGFSGYWPPIADDAGAHPRDRAYAQWQNAVEKVVFSRTLTEVPGPNAPPAPTGPATAWRRSRAARSVRPIAGTGRERKSWLERRHPLTGAQR